MIASFIIPCRLGGAFRAYLRKRTFQHAKPWPHRQKYARGELNFLAPVPDLEPELPAFEAHHHAPELLPGNLPSVDHEHR